MGHPFCIHIDQHRTDGKLVADVTGAASGNGKAALRRRLLSARAGLSAQERAAAEQALRDAVLGLPQAQMAGTAAVYYSIGAEPGTHGLVYALWKRGTYVLRPESADMYPQAPAQTVSVAGNRFTPVRIVYDSGIR